MFELLTYNLLKLYKYILLEFQPKAHLKYTLFISILLFLKYVVDRLRQENILSYTAVDTGNVQNIYCNEMLTEIKSKLSTKNILLNI